MLKWFLPQESNFFEYFDAHAALIVEITQEIQKLFYQKIDAETAKKRIHEIEHKADAVAHQCIEALHKTFITPIERNDIHRLISRMDDIVDYVDEVATRFAIYKMAGTRNGAMQLADVLALAALDLQNIVRSMRFLKENQSQRELFIHINQLENDGDRLIAEALSDLFAEENDVKTLIKWKEILENLENAIDRCEDVANVVEGIILENE